ncbi:MAG: uroporphyrinogen-III C-methyltransferase [Bacteroidota bacterium]|nr:uroporphyrinogen-III C-methyltransferase [Bacteroidota bacterium]
MLESKIPKLSLVGAGPGNIDMVTLGCLKTLKSADVILYDKLINPKLLDYASPVAEKIYVGKAPGLHYMKQEIINGLIIEKAFSRGHVVRLKGGDPFIFGRGYEEMAAAKAAGIPVEVIPGISSSIGLAGLKQIPLTARGYNESLWITTGTTQTGAISEDVKLAAKSSATIVILMGMHRLEEIINIFYQENKQNIPVAIIQNGSLPDEKMIIGIVSNILTEAKENDIKSPAVIIIGEVIRLSYPEHFAPSRHGDRLADYISYQNDIVLVKA